MQQPMTINPPVESRPHTTHLLGQRRSGRSPLQLLLPLLSRSHPLPSLACATSSYSACCTRLHHA